MSKVTIEKISSKIINTVKGEAQSVGIIVKEHTVTDVDGKELSTRDGDKARFINGFLDKGAEIPFSEGDQVELKIKEKVTDRGVYLNFYLPNKTDNLISRVEELEKAVASLVSNMQGSSAQQMSSQDGSYTASTSTTLANPTGLTGTGNVEPDDDF